MLGCMIQLESHILSTGWFNHQQDDHVKDPSRWISSTFSSQETRKKRIELDSDYSRGRHVPMHADFSGSDEQLKNYSMLV